MSRLRRLAAPTQRPNRPRGPVLLAAGAVLIVAVVVVVLLLSRGGSTPAPSPAAKSPSATASPAKHVPAPRARFKLERLPSVSGSRHPRQAKVRNRARDVAARIKDVIQRVYTFAFLDTRRTRSRLLDIFVGEARRKFRTHPQIVALGSAARRLAGLRQQHSTLRVRTLFSPNNHPVTSLAVAEFRARGRLRAGGRLLVRNHGTFFLRPGEHGWVIYGFEVRRQDRAGGG